MDNPRIPGSMLNAICLPQQVLHISTLYDTLSFITTSVHELP
jgi:hypothetical protein